MRFIPAASLVQVQSPLLMKRDEIFKSRPFFSKLNYRMKLLYRLNKLDGIAYIYRTDFPESLGAKLLPVLM